MNYLKQFWTIFKEYLIGGPKIRTKLPDTVDEHEPLSRYLTSRSWFSRENDRVKNGAFMPPQDLKLSVFRTQGLSDSRIWELGEEEVIKKAPTPKTLYGRADIVPLIVKMVGLEVDPDNIPPRHANIARWPQEKSEQKLVALQLAEEATLKLRI